MLSAALRVMREWRETGDHPDALAELTDALCVWRKQSEAFDRVVNALGKKGVTSILLTYVDGSRLTVNDARALENAPERRLVAPVAHVEPLDPLDPSAPRVVLRAGGV